MVSPEELDKTKRQETNPEIDAAQKALDEMAQAGQEIGEKRGQVTDEELRAVISCNRTLFLVEDTNKSHAYKTGERYVPIAGHTIEGMEKSYQEKGINLGEARRMLGVERQKYFLELPQAPARAADSARNGREAYALSKHPSKEEEREQQIYKQEVEGILEKRFRAFRQQAPEVQARWVKIELLTKPIKNLPDWRKSEETMNLYDSLSLGQQTEIIAAMARGYARYAEEKPHPESEFITDYMFEEYIKAMKLLDEKKTSDKIAETPLAEFLSDRDKKDQHYYDPTKGMTKGGQFFAEHSKNGSLSLAKDIEEVRQGAKK